MSVLEYQRLPQPQKPLLVKFYRSHHNRNRVRPEASCWVARCGEIIAGLCLTPVADGHFLTGLLVSPAERGRGIGQGLVRRALRCVSGPVWLFCKPELQEFYARLGFSEAVQLPQTLEDRLARYRRSKTLIALTHSQKEDAMPDATLNIAIACLFDEHGRLLVVRKRGTRFFMLPGGKAEPGETALQTLRRELAEELALSLEDRDLESLGQFRAPAANEPNHQVQAQVFVGRLPHPVSVQAEIEEMGWLDLEPCHRDDVAPLLRTQVLPALLERAVARA